MISSAAIAGSFHLRLFLITSLTMIAFAANSVFARVALGAGTIDPAGYSLVRLVSGAAMLAFLVLRARNGKFAKVLDEGSWASAGALFAYAAAFSFAYVVLHTGTGALILFACVQGTMIGWALIRGDRPIALEWLGLIVAFGAFVWLVSPGLAGPDPVGAGLMAVSGIAWGIYSLRGKSASDPLSATAGNFVRSVPIAIVLAAIFLSQLQASPFGLLMAALSGAVTSGMGYALWYQALRGLTPTQGAIVQLTVPAIAAAGGIALLGEPLTLRFAICSILILGGVAIAILARTYRRVR
jgi:drug/metabolite transporter (DMT)-like permease